MKKFCIFLSLLLTTYVQAASNVCVVTPDGIGKIKLGQTLAQAKRAYPNAKLSQETDAEGVDYTVFTIAPNIRINAFFVQPNEHDGAAKKRESKRIATLETFSSGCHTVQGVYPTMRLSQAQKYLGSLKEIEMSEIEMREFAEFTKQPNWLTMRVEGGDFGTQDVKLPMKTRQFLSNAKILSLAIAE